MIRLAALALLVACGGDAASSGARATAPLEPTTRDSAGITIHEHPADALERAPLIAMDSVPLAVFAGSAADPSQDLSTTGLFAFVADGRLVGLDYQASQVVHLDPAQRTAERTGRGGEGPGELGRIMGMARLGGDSLLLTDGSNTRLAVAAAGSGIVRTIPLTHVDRAANFAAIGATSSGTILMRQAGFEVGGDLVDGPFRFAVAYASWQPGQDTLAILFEVPGARMIQTTRAVGDRRGFSRRAVALTASPRVVAWDNGFLVATAEKWRLRFHDVHGVVRRSYRIDHTPVVVTDAMRERHVVAAVAAALRRDPDADVAKARETAAAGGYADHLPAHEAVHVAPNEVLWIVDYRLPGDSGWAATAFDTGGRILGRIVEPAGDPPVAFGDDRVAFRSEDDDGIATIMIRRLTFP
jgi:hypothetical protein